jgi:hypothetical protein
MMISLLITLFILVGGTYQFAAVFQLHETDRFVETRLSYQFHLMNTGVLSGELPQAAP